MLREGMSWVRRVLHLDPMIFVDLPLTELESDTLSTWSSDDQIDVHVQRVGTSERFSLHNGLFGPATTAFHAVLDACRDGRATGKWSISHATVQLPGRVLREVLADVGVPT